MKKIVVWAHRGASCKAPENTLAAFRLAQRFGADGVELDVRLTADGIPVVMHDDTLDRTTDFNGELKDFSLADLQSVDAGSWFAPRYAGEPIPTLDQVLRWAASDLRLNLEIKEFAAGMAVVGLLERFPRCRALVSSFDHALLEALRRKATWLSVGFLSAQRHWVESIDDAVACGAESFHPRQDLVLPEHVRLCHARGLKVYPWVVDDRQRFKALLDMGVDGLFTNDPDQVCRWRDHTAPAG